MSCPTQHRPVIGIIGNSALLNESYAVHAGGTMNSEAVAEVAGCLPLIIPSDPRFVRVAELLDLCDGFLLTGGRPNVHPSEYGEEETPAHGCFDRCRDAITLPLIRACVDRGQFALRHTVRFEKGGVFHSLMGAEEVMTNTLHGQGIARPGPRIVIEGWAPDGTPEAIYVKDAPGFTLSVQWHPEWNAAGDPVSRPLFTAFGAAAAEFAAARRGLRVAKSA